MNRLISLFNGTLQPNFHTEHIRNRTRQNLQYLFLLSDWLFTVYVLYVTISRSKLDNCANKMGGNITDIQTD